MSTNKAWCSWSLPKHRAALASVHWVWHSLSKLSVPNLQISDLLLHFALPSPHDCGCSGAGRASVAAGPGAGCVGAAVGTESGNFATPAGVGSLLNYPQRLFAEASRSLLGKCCLGRRVVPWNSILDVMHKSVSIWSIRNMLKRHNFLNLALEPWRAWTLNRRLTPPQELFEVCMERSSIVQYLYVFVSPSAGMLIRHCLQGAAVRAACQAKFLNTLATLDAKKHYDIHRNASLVKMHLCLRWVLEARTHKHTLELADSVRFSLPIYLCHFESKTFWAIACQARSFDPSTWDAKVQRNSLPSWAREDWTAALATGIEAYWSITSADSCRKNSAESVPGKF